MAKIAGGALPGPNERKNVNAARTLHLQIVENLYDLLGVETEQRGGNLFFGETIGAHPSTVNHVTLFLKKNGFLTFRYVGMPPGSTTPGKITLWTLHGTKEDAVAALKASWGKQGVKKQPVSEAAPAPRPEKIDEPVALAPEKSSEVTRAIAGPEPESPFAVLRSLRKDESGALVEAARQYANRMKLVETKLAELAEAGIHVDVSAIKLDKDERLEVISLVLPYINSLESALHNLSEQNESLRKKLADFDQIKRSYEVLKKRFDGAVASRVASDMIAASR